MSTRDELPELDELDRKMQLMTVVDQEFNQNGNNAVLCGRIDCNEVAIPRLTYYGIPLCHKCVDKLFPTFYDRVFYEASQHQEK